MVGTFLTQAACSYQSQ